MCEVRELGAVCQQNLSHFLLRPSPSRPLGSPTSPDTVTSPSPDTCATILLRAAIHNTCAAPTENAIPHIGLVDLVHGPDQHSVNGCILGDGTGLDWAGWRRATSPKRGCAICHRPGRAGRSYSVSEQLGQLGQLSLAGLECNVHISCAQPKPGCYNCPWTLRHTLRWTLPTSG